MILPDEMISLQYHNHRSEHWVVVKGSGTVICDHNTIEISVDNHFYVPMKSVHRIINNSDQELIIIEVQIGTRIDEEDIVRLEDKYDRKD